MRDNTRKRRITPLQGTYELSSLIYNIESQNIHCATYSLYLLSCALLPVWAAIFIVFPTCSA